jgi:hypothetical protein
MDPSRRKLALHKEPSKYILYLVSRGTHGSIVWLRHVATCQKVADSIPDEVMDFSIDLILPAAL